MCIWLQACSWRQGSCKLEYGWDASSHIKPYQAINTEIMFSAWFLLDIPFRGSLCRKVFGHSSHLRLLEPGRSVKSLRLHLSMWGKGRLDEQKLDETCWNVQTEQAIIFSTSPEFSLWFLKWTCQRQMAICYFAEFFRNSGVFTVSLFHSVKDWFYQACPSHLGVTLQCNQSGGSWCSCSFCSWRVGFATKAWPKKISASACVSIRDITL